MSDETHHTKEIEIVIPAIEIIDEYSRLLTNLKKNHRRGKSLACLSSLAAIKPLHSHLMEILCRILKEKLRALTSLKPQHQVIIFLVICNLRLGRTSRNSF